MIFMYIYVISCNKKFNNNILNFIHFSNSCNKYIKKNYLQGPG